MCISAFQLIEIEFGFLEVGTDRTLVIREGHSEIWRSDSNQLTKLVVGQEFARILYAKSSIMSRARFAYANSIGFELKYRAVSEQPQQSKKDAGRIQLFGDFDDKLYIYMFMTIYYYK